MSDYKTIPILIDAGTGKQINEFGKVVNDKDYFRLLFDETVILCCQFYDVDWSTGAAKLTARPINPSLTLAAFGDSDFKPETAFMFLSRQTEDIENKVNLEDDWLDGSTADPAKGQLSFRVDTNTTRFAEALGNSSAMQSFYFCITGVPSGQIAKTVLAYFRFKAQNRPSSSAGEPETADPEYLNAQEVQALVKSAPDFEFSIDGETLWHTTQVSADRYYRTSRNGGEWSEAIKMIVLQPCEIAFSKSDVDPDTKLMSVNHALNDQFALHVTIANKTTKKELEFDEIIYDDANNLSIDFTNGYGDMLDVADNYYLRITK